MKKTAASFICTVFLLSLVLIPFAHADWPMFHSNPSHTGVGTGGPVLTPTVLWNYSTPGHPIYSSPVTANGVVYINVEGGLFALNATTGSTIWSYKNYYVAASPAVANGVVYISNENGLYAFNATNGAALWSYSTEWGAESSPTIADGIVYFGTRGPGNILSTRFYALNATNGVSLWNWTSIPDINSAPAVYEGIVYLYIGSYEGKLHAINASTGTEVWYTKVGNAAGPAIAKGIVYEGLGNGTFLALNATNGEKIWGSSNVTNSAWVNCPAIANDTLYMGANDGNIYALNASTGAKLWNYTTETRWGVSGASDAPAVAGDAVYFGTWDGRVYALNATTGSILWMFDTPRFGDNGLVISSSPAVDNGVVYIASFYGSLYAFGNSPSVPTIPEFPSMAFVPLLIVIMTTGGLLVHFKKCRRQKPAFAKAV